MAVLKAMSVTNYKKSLLTEACESLYRELCDERVLSMTVQDVPSIADVKSATSTLTSRRMMKLLSEKSGIKIPVGEKIDGQKAGKLFEEAISNFLRKTLPHSGVARPDAWSIERVRGSKGMEHIAAHEPYRHLQKLQEKIETDPLLESILGNSYAIAPDIVIARDALTDEELNKNTFFVDDQSGLLSPTRARNREAPTQILHAVVSCKLTMRSDRSQNTRSEALNLIRNRKGRVPHFVVVTAEPMPSRIASLAMGTGDIDMLYHLALPELRESLDADDAPKGWKEELEMLIEGQRVRDITDLPLDLIS